MPAIKAKFEQFEKVGEQKVREQLASGAYAGKNKEYAEHWLDIIERNAQAEADSRQEEREIEAIKIARKANGLANTANEHADTANKRSWLAFGIAVISALVAIIALFK